LKLSVKLNVGLKKEETLKPICVKFDNTTGRFPAVANSAQSQVTRERLLSLSKCAPLPMNFSVLAHFTHLGKSEGRNKVSLRLCGEYFRLNPKEILYSV
jgi:hypothetical protein